MLFRSIAIVAAFIFFGIVPLYKQITAKSDSILEAETTLQIDQEKQAMLPSLLSANADAQSTVAVNTANYYSVMTSNEIDKLLTNLVVSQGLISRDLQITMPTDEVSVEPYIYSTKKVKQDAEALAEDEEEESSESTSTDSSASSASSVASSASTASTASTSSTSGTTTGTTGDEKASTGVYAVEAVMTVSGTENACQKLIDDLTSSYPSIRITGFSWGESAYNNVTYDSNGNVVIDSAGINTKTMEVDLEIYMMDQTSAEES